MQREVYLCFIDYSKAFDKVQHDKMMELLNKCQLGKENIQMIAEFYWKQKAAIRLENELTDYVQINRGVRQGCVLSPTLFNLYSEWIFRECDMKNDEEGIAIGGIKFNNIRYADDTVLIAETKEQLERMLNEMNVKSKEYGPPFFLRVASTVITPYLHSFMEYSFINGIFPGNCTIARIVPIFKKGERDKPTNYRPISILSCFTKIFEKIIYKRLINFLNKHNVIQKTQYGFQKNISTNHALIDVITNSFDNINNNLYTGLVFLDLTKAFDTVSHDILLHKLDHYGIRGKTNDLIQTFLQRKQYVSVNGVNSNVLANNYGVAQGSTLGPLLFLLYINDLPSSVNCVPRFFADDTCLVYSSSNPSTLNTAINQDLKNISQWFKANKLTVNPSKSNVLIIPHKLNKTVPNMNFFLNNTLIQQSSSVKYLGVIIDFKLSFDIHIKSLEHKISRAVGIMSKLKYFMPKNALQTIYYSFIQSHLIYGLPVWGSTYHSYLKKLRILQNKAVKFIGGDLFQDRITPLYAQSNILKLPNLYKLEVSKLVHAHIRNQLPHKLSNYFTFTSNISSRNTRTTQKKNHLYTPRYKTSRMQKCIKYQGVKIWNDIPSEIQNSNSKNFKRKMKKHLLTLQS